MTELFFVGFLKYILKKIYVVVLGLTCSSQDLQSSLCHMDF